MPTSSNKVGGNSLKKMKRNLPAFLCQKNQKNPCDLGISLWSLDQFQPAASKLYVLAKCKASDFYF